MENFGKFGKFHSFINFGNIQQIFVKILVNLRK